MNETTTPPASNERYELTLDDKSGRLFGVVKPLKPPEIDEEPQIQRAGPSLRSLNEDLKALGFHEFYFPTNSLEQFYKKIQRFDVGKYLLAEKRDAKIKITVARDRSNARVQTDQSWGGTRLTESSIMAEVDKLGIHKDTLDQEKLQQLITAEVAVDLIIANAIPPENGKDASMEPLLESKLLAARDTDSEGAIDQHEVYDFVVVEPGDALVRKTPATAGKEGMDVLGNAIKAKAGADILFEKPFQGVEISPDDENLLIAVQKGHPVFSRYGARVDPVMSLEAVDIHSGNIEYDGSLIIKNDIEAGFVVNVSGDILVKGSIFKASVTSGGNIDVTGGITADDIDDEHGCHLEVAGNLTAKFLHHANVHCHGDVNVHEYIMQCRITAEGFINAGETRGRGCIIGGFCSTNSGINAKVLGSDAYVTTCLSLGSDSELHKELNQLQLQLKRRTFEEEQLTKILEKIRNTGKPTNIGQTTLDKARKIENTIQLLRTRISEIRQQLASLKPRVKISDNLLVNVKGNVFPNVVVSINGHPWSCEETQRRIQIKLKGKKIIVEDLKI
ncbi:hypothetical protein P886_3979 [Alteromonadaceae bacterium 2753L.S.0a.02]|nr:hypothetical protein P886_3979 [Alteromonadaceae bacterium 2753L.S.0a.02]